MEVLSNISSSASVPNSRGELFTSRARCEEGITTWFGKLQEQLQGAGKLLVEEVERVHREEEVKLQQAELSLARHTQDLWDLLESKDSVQHLTASELAHLQTDQENLKKLFQRVNFVPNTNLLKIGRSDVGFLSLYGSKSDVVTEVKSDGDDNTGKVEENKSDKELDKKSAVKYEHVAVERSAVIENVVAHNFEKVVNITQKSSSAPSPMLSSVSSDLTVACPTSATDKQLNKEKTICESDVQARCVGKNVKVPVIKHKKKEVSENLSNDPVRGGEDPLAPGAICLVKKVEDNTWYHVKIHKQFDTKRFVVQYLYKPEFDFFQRDKIVSDVSLVPVGEMINFEGISSKEAKKESDSLEQEKHSPPETTSMILKEGDLCLARWTEDHVWYNARVESVMMGGARVMFTDYGNCCVVGTDFMVTNLDLIPDGELLDVHVGQIG